MTGTPSELIKFLVEQDADKEYDLTEHHEKRSLNANAYAWCLIGKLADVHRASKEEIYMQMLKRYGQSEMVSVLSSIDVSGYFKYFEPIGESFLQGKNFTHYRIYKGSSEYDTKEMAILIDGIVSECIECDISTLPTQEIERLKSLWRA